MPEATHCTCRAATVPYQHMHLLAEMHGAAGLGGGAYAAVSRRDGSRTHSAPAGICQMPRLSTGISVSVREQTGRASG